MHDDVAKLGLSGATIALHSSFRSLGDSAREVSPALVVQAFADVCDTVVAPAFYYQGMCAPEDTAAAPAQNGTNQEYFDYLNEGEPIPFEPKTSDVDASMGVIAQALTAHPESIRSSHPVVGWAALGKDARNLVEPHADDAPFAVLRRLIERSGKDCDARDRPTSVYSSSSGGRGRW